MTSPNASQSGFSQTNSGSAQEPASEGRAVTPQKGQMGARPTSVAGGLTAHGARSKSMWCPRSPTRSMMMCMEANSHRPSLQVYVWR